MRGIFFPRRGRTTGWLLAVLGVVLAAWGPAEAGGPQGKPSLPFSPGERLVFQVKWGFIPAGEAVLEVAPVEELDGVAYRHFVLTARTYPVVDLFYKVRDRIDAYTDEAMTHSILYKEACRGRKEKNVVVKFDWEKREAQRVSSGKKREPVPLISGSFDPLSVFYAFRLHELEEDKEIIVPVSDGKKMVLWRSAVSKREKISIGGKKFEAYLVEPDLKEVGGVFEKGKNARLKIWVTADQRRIPLRIESKVIVGSFVAELASVE